MLKTTALCSRRQLDFLLFLRVEGATQWFAFWGCASYIFDDDNCCYPDERATAMTASRAARWSCSFLLA